MKKFARFFEINCMMKLLVVPFMLMPITKIFAQPASPSGRDESTITRPAQITLISPLGTNGLQSHEVTNVFSLNMVAGYAGGLKGLEIGGFANAINGNVKGVQIAGFANGVKGSTSGAQIAGFANINLGNTNGAQIAGFTNISLKESNATQIAGFTNVVTADATAGQISGFANVVTGDFKGAQIAGFANYSQGDMTGAQIGVFNYAKNVKGAQIGVFNVADSVEKGLAFGVLSFVKNGYRAIEISSNETVHGVLSFKTGTYKFYNILSVGAILNDERAWAVGYGIGTLIPLTKQFDLAIEASAFHLNEDEYWTNELNLLNKLSANLTYNIGERLAVFGGVSYSVAVSQLTNSEGVVVGSSLIPYYSRNETVRGTNLKELVGYNFGLAVKL